jgi:hypothetical protein
MPAQLVVPSAHTQAPPLHMVPGTQRVPQAPQLAPSAAVFTQRPPQSA